MQCGPWPSSTMIGFGPPGFGIMVGRPHECAVIVPYATRGTRSQWILQFARNGKDGGFPGGQIRLPVRNVILPPAACGRCFISSSPSSCARRTSRSTSLHHETNYTALSTIPAPWHPNLIGSEYLIDSTPKGRTNYSGLRCEDLTDLTFADAQFDHVLSFEVLVTHPRLQGRASGNVVRVLKPGGRLFCSAPFHGDEQHTVRASINEDGSIEHLLPPEYHGDPVNPDGVLCYRYFGLEWRYYLLARGIHRRVRLDLLVCETRVPG